MRSQSYQYDKFTSKKGSPKFNGEKSKKQTRDYRYPGKIHTPKNRGAFLRRPPQQGKPELPSHSIPTNSEAHFEYYIDGKPANDPQVAKVLSNLFAQQFSTETKAPTDEDREQFAPKFLPPKYQTHQGHPQQFTQIMIPEGNNVYSSRVKVIN